MRIKSEELIAELTALTHQHLSYAESLKSSAAEALNQKTTPESWSILACLKHLNLYGNYYLSEIEKQLKKSTSEKERQFKSGLLGNQFAKSMWPKEKLNKMKTFKNMDPLTRQLDKQVLDTFIDQQYKLLQLLHQSSNVNLSKVKVGISIIPFIKLKLGDALRVLIYHNERHIQQAKRIMEETKKLK